MKTLLCLFTSVALAISLAAETPAITTPASQPFSGGEDSPLSLSLGALRTQAEKGALRLAVDFVENDINKLIQRQPLRSIGDNGMLLFTPEVHLLTGTEDAFDGLQAKATGLFTFFSGWTDVPGGGPTPDTTKLIHTLPFSLGAESDRSFSRIATLAEFGYVPWFQTDSRIPAFLRYIKPGIFLQGGYIFDGGSPASTDPKQGDSNQGKEQTAHALFRAKAAMLVTTPDWAPFGGELKLKIIGEGALWYDFVNSATYHRVAGILRLSVSKTRHFDFTYERGSGAPNFNKGDQFSAGLTIMF